MLLSFINEYFALAETDLLEYKTGQSEEFPFFLPLCSVD